MPEAASVAASPAAPLKRKIAAILAADVAGFSRLVATDEEGTLRDLAAARQVFDRHVADGGGRIFNTAGDSVMCEFDSAVEAVRTALVIQASLAVLAAGTDASRKLAFRVGITIGDVVERDGDLLGDGVNMASRLESLAPVGGICVSRSVHEAVANKVSAAFRDLGARRVKNIPLPVHAFLVMPEAAGVPPAETLSVEPRARRTDGAWVLSGRQRLMAVLAALLVTGLGWGSWRHADAVSGLLSGAGLIGGGTRQPSPVEPPAAKVPAAKPPLAKAASVEKPAEKPPRAVPSSLREGYEAARAEEQKGDRAAALRAYAALVPLVRDQVDPMLRYAGLLRARQGAEATRKILDEAGRAGPSRAAALVAAAQGDPAQQVARLEAFAAANSDYPPVDYLLAEAYLGRPGAPTLTERRLAFGAIERFLDAARDLPAFFVDRAVLGDWIETARRRRGEIETVFAGASSRPRAHVVPTEAGWSARIILPEPGSRIAVRIGEQGDPIVTNAAGPGERPGNAAEVTLPPSTGRTTLYVAYQDAAGREAGPFPIPFDPAVARAAAARETLERYPESWVSFRPDLPEILSYAQLAANRCGIAKALIGFGDGPPAHPLALPSCDGRATLPGAETRPVLALPAGIDAVQVQIAYADGSESGVRTFRRP